MGDEPAPEATRVRCQLLTFDLPTPLLNGSRLEAHWNESSCGIVLRNLVSKLDKSGNTIKKPRMVGSHTMAVADFELDRSICVETNDVLPRLARICFRVAG